MNKSILKGLLVVPVALLMAKMASSQPPPVPPLGIPTEISETAVPNQDRVWAVGNQIMIEPNQTALAQIYNINGQLLNEKQLAPKELAVINPFTTGMIMVRIISNHEVKIYKLMLLKN